MTDRMEIQNPDKVTVGYDETKGVFTVVIEKRESTTDEDLTYTFTTDSGPVSYAVQRHDTEIRTTRM